MRRHKRFIRYFVRSQLERYPDLFVSFAYYYNLLRSKSTERIVTSKSDICIDGYPRSSNSFAAKAIRHYHEGKLSIATHLHSPAQIIKAVKLGVPAIVMIRKPEGCIISNRALTMEIAEKENRDAGLLPIQLDLRAYIYFYTSLLPYKDQLLTAEFNTVITDFNQVVKGFNIKFNKQYPTDLDHGKLEKMVFDSSGFHLSPSVRRNEYKQRAKEEYDNPELKNLVEKAEQAYTSFLN